MFRAIFMPPGSYPRIIPERNQGCRKAFGEFGTNYPALQPKNVIPAGVFGEPARVRTVDLLIKSQLLYQLSYGLPKAGRLRQKRFATGGYVTSWRRPVSGLNLNQRSRNA